MVVLVALVLMTTQLISSATRATNRSGKLMDADSQARLVFDRLGADIARLDRLGGMDSIFAKADGGTDPSDKMFFFGKGPGFYGNSTSPFTAQDNSGFSLVGYRVKANQSKMLQLERLGKTLTWTGSYNAASSAPGAPLLLSFRPGTFEALDPSTLGVAYQSVIGTSGKGYADGQDPDFHVLGDQVFRFEYCFLLSDGTMSNLPLRERAAAPAVGQPKWTVTTGVPTINSDASQGYAAGPAGMGTGSLWFDNSPGAKRTYRCASSETGAAVWVPGGLEGVSAIVVAIAVLDDTTRRLNVDTTALAQLLTDPTDSNLASSPPVTMAVLWNKTILDPGFANTARIPPSAASSIQVYQRVFYLNQ
ncbi:MAG: hypothetical protein INR62_01430 [Rhodospirillales bacterium]|nr:hypothetical protein [Acetobacter sp.]